jgi:hypothetical protein
MPCAVRCESRLVSGASRCFIVNGGFTLLYDYDKYGEPDDIEILIRRWAANSTDTIISSGYFNQGIVHPEIVDVRFLHSIDVHDEIYSNRSVTNDIRSSSTIRGPLSVDEGNATVSYWAWTAIASGLVFFVVTMAIFFRRTRKSDAFDRANIMHQPFHSFDDERESLDLREASVTSPNRPRAGWRSNDSSSSSGGNE